MSESREQRIRRIQSGEDRSLGSGLLRLVTAGVEPLYAGVMRTRNALYDAGMFGEKKLPRPAISVGNLTTGGTGKTPVVRWIAQRLIKRGLLPAVLTRGYRADRATGSDEAQMLASQLGERACVIVNPNRISAAMQAMRAIRQPDVFILDDGFQHRRAARDFNLVLINATAPFGFDHVLPRGLLREPLAGLARASAILITRADQVEPSVLDAIKRRVRIHAPRAPIYRSSHAHVGLRTTHNEFLPMDELSRGRFILFCGIADPASLEKQLARFGENFAGATTFDDHHQYSPADIESIKRAVQQAGAELAVTTEKDFVKLDQTARDRLPIVRLDLQLQFHGDDEEQLVSRVIEAIQKPASLPTAKS